MTLTPDQVKLLIKIAFLAALVIAGGVAGWTLNGWRLSGQINSLKTELQKATDQVAVLADATKACSKSVEDGARVGAEAVRQMGALVDEAKKNNAGARGQVARLDEIIKSGRKLSCDEAWAEIERQRLAGGAR